VAFLKESNGLYYKDLILFGVSPSLFRGDGINRSQLGPMCITRANKEWRYEYKAPSESTMVGYLEDWDENTGIFMIEDGVTYTINTEDKKKFESLENLVLYFIETQNKEMQRS